MFSSAEELLAYVKDEGVEIVDVRVCDLPGIMQHFTVPVSSFGPEVFEDGLAGGTIGHRLFGLRVLNRKNKEVAQVGLLGGVIRSFLICLLIPAVIFDRDHRGLHDLAAKTVVVRR